jgi:hypothetical protein
MTGNPRRLFCDFANFFPALTPRQRFRRPNSDLFTALPAEKICEPNETSVV